MNVDVAEKRHRTNVTKSTTPVKYMRLAILEVAQTDDKVLIIKSKV